MLSHAEFSKCGNKLPIGRPLDTTARSPLSRWSISGELSMCRQVVVVPLPWRAGLEALRCAALLNRWGVAVADRAEKTAQPPASTPPHALSHTHPPPSAATPPAPRPSA